MVQAVQRLVEGGGVLSGSRPAFRWPMRSHAPRPWGGVSPGPSR